MSKLDAQRAMREAKYARSQAQGAARTSPARPRATPPVAPPEPAAPSSAPATATSSDTCGHRSMNGRTCTREAGHSEKSHRYS